MDDARRIRSFAKVGVPITVEPTFVNNGATGDYPKSRMKYLKLGLRMTC